MLYEICSEIRNFFTYKDDILINDYTIVDGDITPSINITSDYIRIVGSKKNNGVFKVSEMQLADEPEFHGSVWLMNPPQDFLDLATEIQAWQNKYGNLNSEAMSPFNSESFGGYSYSKGGSRSTASGSSTNVNVSWQSVFSSRLKIYRRIRVL